MRYFLTVLLVIASLGVLGGLAEPSQAQVAGRPSLTMPWEGGAVWRYMNGPHTASGPVEDALDLQPPDSAGQTCEAFTSAFWAVAAAPGRAIVMPNAVEVDHGNGYRTGYYHLADKQVHTGDAVSAGQRLGRPGCCPDGGTGVDCWATEPHLHFYTVGPGGRLPIAGQHIGGWLVDSDGCLVRPERRACRGAALISNSPRSEAEAAARVALTVAVDGSASMDSPTTRLAVSRLLAPYLTASKEGKPVTFVRFDERSAVVSVNAESDVNAVIDAGSGGGGEDVTDLRAGLTRACEEMRKHGTEVKQALVLISDGLHNAGRLLDPAKCFREAGWKVFSVSAGRANSGLLKKIAAETGGSYKAAPAIFDPACEMERVRAVVAGSGGAVCSRFLLMPGDRLAVPFDVPPEQSQASIALSAVSAETPPAVGLGIALRDPSDKVVVDGDVLAHESDGRGERYAIARPAVGTWKAIVSAREVPAEGVLVDLSFVTTPIAFGYSTGPEGTASPSPSPDPDENATDTPTPDPDGTESPVSTPSPRATRAPAISPTPAPTAEPTPLRPTPSPVR
jgi:hypothetical protein